MAPYAQKLALKYLLGQLHGIFLLFIFYIYFVNGLNQTLCKQKAHPNLPVKQLFVMN